MRELRDHLNALCRDEAELTRRLEGEPDSGAPPDPMASLLLVQSRRITSLARWLELLTDWAVQGERRRVELAGRVDDHEEALRMVCVALKELDDPYGFGESLDDQIAEDRRGSDDEWDVA